MYALFAAIPFVGHINPLLKQAAALRRRGWRVAVAAHRDLAAHVGAEAPDVPFVDLGPLGPIGDYFRVLEEAASADRNYTRAALRMAPMLTDVWPSQFDGLTAAVARDRPDVMVVDLFTSAGFAAADAAGVPVVANNPALLAAVPLPLLPPARHIPFITSGRSIHAMRRWDRACEPLLRHATTLVLSLTLERRLRAHRTSRGLPAATLADLLRGRLILVNGVFGVEYARALPTGIHMVGPMLDDEVPPLSPDLAAWLTEGPPVIYANLGTVAHPTAAQLAKMADAFRGDEFRVLWVLRDRFRDRLPAALPAGVRLVNWIESPRAVLAHPNVRTFVSHCGINSVYESIAAGTPVVGIPIFSDQRDMAVRVSDAGAGLWVDKSRFTATQLRAALDRVRLDPGFRSRITALQDACAAAGGIRRAADLIEDHARACAV